MEQETLSLVLAVPHPGTPGCCWEISQADYCYKKSFIWLFKPLMSAPSTLKRTHIRLHLREQTEGLQVGIKEKQTSGSEVYRMIQSKRKMGPSFAWEWATEASN